jgi:putative endonuclease
LSAELGVVARARDQAPIDPPRLVFACPAATHSSMTRRPFIAVYIMANRRYGTLYVGVTADLETRVHQHQSGEIPGFTQRYGLRRLVWFEQHETIIGAIQREKSLKKYERDWKINLIERENPYWYDLSANWGLAL